MKEMLMLLAATISKEEVINKLREALDQYDEAQLLQNEEQIKQADQELFVATNLFIMNYVTKGDIKEAVKNIRHMDEIEKAHNFFKTPKN